MQEIKKKSTKTNIIGQVFTSRQKHVKLHYQLKCITLSGSKFIKLSGESITLSGSDDVIMCFTISPGSYYTNRQLLQCQL